MGVGEKHTRWAIGALAIALVAVAVSMPAFAPAGAQTSAPAVPARASDHVVVTDAKIVGNGPRLAAFGAAPDRELVLTVQNTGTETLQQLPISMSVGHDPTPLERERVAVIDRIGPGEQRTVEVPLNLGAFAMGTYRVEGAVASVTPFGASTSVTPWGLIVLVLAAGCALVAFAVYRMWASRNRPSAAATVAATVSEGEAVVEPETASLPTWAPPPPETSAEHAVAAPPPPAAAPPPPAAAPPPPAAAPPPPAAAPAPPAAAPPAAAPTVDREVLEDDIATVLVGEVQAFSARHDGRPPGLDDVEGMADTVVGRVAERDGLDASASAALRDALVRELTQAFAPTSPR